MATLAEWQKILKAAADYRFPNSGWTLSDRIASVCRQVDDVNAAHAVEQGTLVSDDHAHQDLNHRIGALIADALILAEERGVDTEAELKKVLAWFKDHPRVQHIPRDTVHEVA